jgi:hypothetical protein
MTTIPCRQGKPHKPCPLAGFEPLISCCWGGCGATEPRHQDMMSVFCSAIADTYVGFLRHCHKCEPFKKTTNFFCSDYSFWVHHLVNRDDRHLLAHAMASDFSVAWQCLSKSAIVFSLRIKLHALIRLGVAPPSIDTGAQNGVLCASLQSH